MDLSVVIPTYNGMEKLRKVLESLAGQTLPRHDFEVVIVDDGSERDVRGEVGRLNRDLQLQVRCFRQENKGANAARNLGVREARAEIILFLGDDSVACPRLLEEHMKYHVKFNGAGVRGYVKPYPGFEPTCFSRYYIQRNHELEYRGIFRHKDDLGSMVLPFTTANSSISKEGVIRAGLFEEKLSEYGWQDVEFSYKLKGQGIRFVFNSEAVSFHYHYFDFPAFCRRMEQIGRSAVMMARRYPELKMYMGINPLVFLSDALFFFNRNNIHLFNMLIRAAERNKWGSVLHGLYSIVTTHYFVKGVRERRRSLRRKK